MNKIKCDFCKRVAYVDGRTKWGYWAYMCRDCFRLWGVGLGIGHGQILKELEGKE